jgi:glyoxylase-like metal-dependent hydrolase (beta-lactamase superfamily II)
VITDGARRVEIHYFGRAHSAGDLVVFLPKEGVLAMADLWAENTGQMLLDSGLDGRDGSVLEGPVTLKRIRELDFNIALPGHVGVMHSKSALDAAIANGERMVAQIREKWARGGDVEEVLQKMPPPGNASPFIADRWRRVIISAFEELDQRWQLGMELPGAP